MGRVTCSSHLPILAELIRVSGAKRVLEFGAGLYSTPLLVKLCDSVTSIETHPIWYEKVKKLIGANSKLMFHHVEQNMVLHYYHNSLVKYDLVFVDTVNKIRKQLVELSVQCTDNIVLHDAQTPAFRNIVLKDYKKFVFTKCPIKYKNGSRPFTTLWSRNNAVITHFEKVCEEDIYLRNAAIW